MCCQKCKSDSIIRVNGKTSDLLRLTTDIDNKRREHDGYVPDGLNIGQGDYLRFDYCASCGQIQGKFPIEKDNILFAFGIDLDDNDTDIVLIDDDEPTIGM